MFYNRQDELDLLDKAYAKGKAELIILYGRRRIGKTALLKEFIKKYNGLYLMARQESEHDQLKKLSSEIARHFSDPVLEKNPFQSYDAMFTYIAEKAGRTPIIFDEFPYLVETKKALPSILQDHWDNFLSKKKPFIILCGSSISMMESLLGIESPLYGRRTQQILLNPLSFLESKMFFSKLKKEELVKVYAILGGTPAYLLEWEESLSISDNIRNTILAKNTFLGQDVLFVLRSQLSEPRHYFSILKSIAKGNTKLSHIINDTGLNKGLVGKYISVLIDLHLVERKIPITKKQSSRKGLYFLADNYFSFWFRFVFEQIDYIEQDLQSQLFRQKIEPELNTYVGEKFEHIVRQWIGKQKQFENYLIGGWWDKSEEIDIVGIDESKKTLLVGKVKWKTLTRKDIHSIIKKLKSKVTKVKWGNNPEINYVIVAKNIIEKDLLYFKDVALFDLDDIVK